MCNFIKKLFKKCKSKRIMNYALSLWTAEQILSSVLQYVVKEGLCKDYKSIKDFVDRHPSTLGPEVALMALPHIAWTIEISNFAKKFKVLHCKTQCKILEEFLSK